MNKQTPVEFSEQLIKGKIAELVFSQMFRKGKQFTIIPFGYENTFPEIAQYQYLADDKAVFETIRNAPDFAIVSHDKRDVYLIEVKYKHALMEKYVKSDAERIQNQWKSVHLFIATPEGFYLDDCSEIIKNNGLIRPLDYSWISESDQKEYLELINEFICKP